ncbi:hypothetical protein HS088_TW06G00484 [Tripterygium wilfordii]|uniref:Uncharacterized protein n=1 Tax=Tripterygium wilfordii TaxID=458696 RepID=A0A7J7DJ23_TRIWF|nr:anthocyanidin-3-O-glucoside rhamnosyltransferase-like [Tripterygium wilfordii]KAF5746313.1 hypothetical protein HS088_TW06G00484 [Tripterygium wilfordii]
MAKSDLHAVMVSHSAFGHISPFVQLSNKLSLHRVRISFLTVAGNVSRVKSLLTSSPNIEVIPLTLPPIEGLSADLQNTADIKPSDHGLLSNAIDLMEPQVQNILSHLKPHFIFYDMCLSWVPKIASELGIQPLCFSVFSAVAAAYWTYPARPKNPSLEDLKKLPNGFPSTSITSIPTFQARDLMYVFTSFNGRPSVFDRFVDSINSSTAFFIKSCYEMEWPYLDFTAAQFRKPVFCAGPLVPDPPSGILEEKWDTWLSQFPSKSVIFCNFGSETFLSEDQIRELVLALDLTGLPFFLVLKFPAEVNGEAHVKQAIPNGLLERVKGKGVVHIKGWIQQQLILGHDSVGCYVNHSGYSSVIEGIVSECQLVFLPFKGDQFLNAKLMAGDMKAGVEVNRGDEDGYFGKEDIVEAIKTVMIDVDKEPGASIRTNNKKWREFLLNKEIQDKFITDMVEQMKAMV